MSLLCAVLKLAAGEWQIIPSNPCRGIGKPVGEQRKRRLSEEEERQLRVALYARSDNGRLSRFVMTAFYTGMRAGEIAKLEKSAVSLEKKQILLKMTKNSESRLVPISDEMCNVIRGAIDSTPKDSPYVFPSYANNGSYSPYDYSGPWRRTLKAAGIGDLRFHDLRHEFVSRLFEKTPLSDGQIAALSGHKSPQALWRYKHLRNEQMRPVIEEHTLQLIQRDVMREVEEDVQAALKEAMHSETPDWEKIRRVIGAKAADRFQKLANDKNDTKPVETPDWGDFGRIFGPEAANKLKKPTKVKSVK
jgi:integrase